MDKTLRNTFVASVITIIIAFVGAWIQLNSRIAVLEVQVSNDHASILKTNQDIELMKDMLHDIKIGVQHLQDVKKDK